jgi:integrase
MLKKVCEFLRTEKMIFTNQKEGPMSNLLKQETNTFESIAREWYQMLTISSSPSHARRIMAYLETYLFPCLGACPITLIPESELLSVFRRIEIRSRAKAHRVMCICNRVFMHAFSRGLIQSNPIDKLRGALAPITQKAATAPDPEDIGPILKAVDAYPGSQIVRAAMQLAPLVIVRPEQLRLTEWVDVDFEGRRLNIPAARTALRSPHIVPLSHQALDILLGLYAVTGSRKYVFASPISPQRCINANSITAALLNVGFNLNRYSFRRMGAMVLSEIIGARPDLIELQLGYRPKEILKWFIPIHTLFLPERSEMMQQLADYFETVKG